MINPSRYWIHDSLHFVDRLVFYCEFLPITIFSVHSLKGKFQGCDILLRQYWNYFCCFGVYMCTYFWKEDPMFRFVVCFVNVCASVWHKILLLAFQLSINVKSIKKNTSKFIMCSVYFNVWRMWKKSFELK